MATYQELFKHCKKKFDFEWLYGCEYAEKKIQLSAATSHYPQLSLDFLNLIHPDRLQFIGPSEAKFLTEIDSESLRGIVQKLRDNQSLGIVICQNVQLPELLITLLKEANLPTFRSSESSEVVLTGMRRIFFKLLANRCSMHGVFMDVYGIGVLLSGHSGIGKSELGLELITRGHGLVADDVVDFVQSRIDTVEGSPPALLANLLEVRGIGLLNIKTIFGETAVRRKMRLNLIAELKQFDQGELMERLPETELFTDVLGVKIRRMIVPVGGGRNLAVLVEAAVRSAILQARGINTVQEFFNRQRQLMEAEEEL